MAQQPLLTVHEDKLQKSFELPDRHDLQLHWLHPFHLGHARVFGHSMRPITTQPRVCARHSVITPWQKERYISTSSMQFLAGQSPPAYQKGEKAELRARAVAIMLAEITHAHLHATGVDAHTTSASLAYQRLQERDMHRV